MDIQTYIKPLIMNGLNGRMLRIPTKNSRYNKEILLLCGHHSSIERMQSFIEVFNDYGNVTVPDLPGFGGMEPFYKIGEKATIDNYADYLASFVKLRYKRKKFIIVGVSFSVPVYVKMLQKYPELQKKVEFCVSLSGFVHHEDFKFNKTEVGFIKFSTWVMSHRIPSFLVTKLFLKEKLVASILKIDYLNRKQRKSDLDAIRHRIKLDSKLWVINDFRTAIYTYHEMFSLNLCDKTVKTPIYHLTPKNDHFFEKNVVEQHMQIIFSQFKQLKSIDNVHLPAIDADKTEVSKYIPKKVKDLLKKK